MQSFSYPNSMNLYSYYKYPEKLNGYDLKDQLVPALVFQKLKYGDFNGEPTLYEKYISDTAYYSWEYATKILKGRFKLEEQTILNSIFKNHYLHFLKVMEIEI